MNCFFRNGWLFLRELRTLKTLMVLYMLKVIFSKFVYLRTWLTGISWCWVLVQGYLCRWLILISIYLSSLQLSYFWRKCLPYFVEFRQYPLKRNMLHILVENYKSFRSCDKMTEYFRRLTILKTDLKSEKIGLSLLDSKLLIKSLLATYLISNSSPVLFKFRKKTKWCRTFRSGIYLSVDLGAIWVNIWDLGKYDLVLERNLHVLVIKVSISRKNNISPNIYKWCRLMIRG